MLHFDSDEDKYEQVKNFICQPWTKNTLKLKAWSLPTLQPQKHIEQNPVYPARTHIQTELGPVSA